MTAQTVADPAPARLVSPRATLAAVIVTAAASGLVTAGAAAPMPRIWTSPSAQLLYLGGWTLMTVAMMLPAAAPLLVAVRRVAGTLASAGLAAVAYLLVWVLTGVLVEAPALALHRLLQGGGPDGSHQHAPAVLDLVLGVAGLAQMTPLTSRCLRACRSPFGFLARGWHGDRPVRDVLRVGLAYGVSCVGCCWPLLLVLLAVGMAAPPAAVAVGSVMALEKLAPGGQAIRSLVGFGVVVAGAVLMFL